MNIHENLTIEKLNTKSKPFITPREKKVLELIAKGMTNQQIAEKSD
jgi:DNA-binding NarL/FixJ family response regulator